MQGDKVKKTLLLLVTLILISFYGYSGDKKIYSWKDKNGVSVFSDTPKPGAQEIKLTNQSLSMPTVDTSILDEQQPAAVKSYKAVISSPADQGTVRENTGSVYVTSRITPRFENGFKIQLLVDGAPYAEPSNISTFALREVNRGEHTLQLKLFDPQGSVVSVSPVSTFYMHRASSL
ncbi:DUF4124 domain-containing protein [Pseudoalteromonas sp. SR44-5]|jgi:hypothetical protein|uniref:DUF4124 domain-containing protein n=1 Tax=Pseudoalteromonas neustonica TaxID=1840331 RepID=A0ABY3FE91_9GAMM|nr:DUF4124 domain-containing protein [Pseudoalteromonas sp. SR41-4]MBB1303217.1 DUF4124 domain-containing protein [Pseudoalteromonas sp. SR44-8]MBB1310251.1 DUF4124 domain-containing protein [Pseudoalteromonas sp. SR41-8]MBB1334769.1 DUF4124 domain-containing protein [Pseudoalteromonas sp. SR41-6]MBB1343025.1 DUF4124 domain-containing protein [Pseudoalteromonas sp. SR45-6]MBB1367960.1 DUF4124 domain-containing protein [Pseudoalteromonas sp. SR44-5]MBB1399532.1 DUF4124 domain-containing protei|tara:strand:- start:3127 stop:3654 length:528 start_codon:yes stop_codon:yes gene_type:complete